MISVIVPVYQSEKYLSRCVDSILGQKETDFELILVDDGSSDGSGVICDEYALRDSRVRVIHQPNKGASAARNQGIELARGEYLMFCDSDDFVSPMWIERLLTLADKKTMAVGAYCSESSRLGTQKELQVSVGKSYHVNRYYEFNRSGIAGYVCNSLFAADIVRVNNIRFRERRESGDYNEDLLFVLQYISHIENVAYTGYADYCYESHEGSLSRSFSRNYFPKYEEKFWSWLNFINYAEENARDNLDHLAQYMMYHFIEGMRQAFLTGNKPLFREIICSDAVEKCLEISDTIKENPYILALLRKKKATTLWILLTFSKLKGRLKK